MESVNAAAAGMLAATSDSFPRQTESFERDSPRTDELCRLIECVRDLPFAVVEDRTVEFLVRHGIGTCTPKHELLHRLLANRGIRSRIVYVLVEYDFERARFHELFPEFCPDGLQPHTSLQVWWQHKWCLVDVTFDRYLSNAVPSNLCPLEEDFSIGRVHRLVPRQSDGPGRRAHLGLARKPTGIMAADRCHYKAINRLFAEMRRPHYRDIVQNHRLLQRYVDAIPPCKEIL